MQDIDLREHERCEELHYEAAVLDCNAALDLDPGNVKALFRKARAVHGLRRHHEALVLAQEAVTSCTQQDAVAIKKFIASIKPQPFGAETAELD